MSTIKARLLENLAGNQRDYNMPFLWMHGEDHDTLARELDKIYDCGIRGVCVESRPHENFCREQWWGDMELILSRCREKGMEVWLLDDKHFPTGFCNNAIDEKYPHLRKRCIIEKHTDVRGPMNQGAVILPPMAETDALIAVVAARRAEDAGNEFLTGDFRDVTGCVRDGLIWLDLPAGVWRIYTIYAQQVLDGHMDTLNPDSVDVLINEVYETHYDHFKDDFGKVFRGFFSDEPFVQRNALLGLRRQNPPLNTSLPWNDLLCALLSEKLGEDCRKYLPCLWHFSEEISPRFRSVYMDCVTELYNRHFNKRVADWCHAHGVQYIGHIIEDDNRHSDFRSGGHYFRALDDMDMAGIDVVLCQIVPGMQDHRIHVPCSYDIADPDFFSFGLAKLASSHAHVQPKKQGRAMCEMFGAYGWAEGLKMMKWLVDHMIVRGINRFVPHAFSMKPNDPDCPPHFYAGGENPQYPGFGELMGYADRQIHLMTAGKPVTGSAILYHAEAEWAGGEYQYFHTVARAMTEAQLEFDILSCDYLLTGAAEKGQLQVNDCRFDSLIVPMSEFLPRAVLEKLKDLAAAGVPILWVDKKCEKTTESAAFDTDFGTIMPLAALAGYVREHIGWDVNIPNGFRQLRYAHRREGDAHVYMFFNESVDETFAGELQFSVPGEPVIYDPWTGKVTRGKLTLAPYETRFVFFGVDVEAAEEAPLTGETVPEIRWQYAVEGVEYSELGNIAPKHSRFGGTISYYGAFDGAQGRVLDLGQAGETVEVTLNGEYLGRRIAPPYTFDVAGKLKEHNELTVAVTTHLGYNRRDRFSMYLQLEPMGLLGPVTVKR